MPLAIADLFAVFAVDDTTLDYVIKHTCNVRRRRRRMVDCDDSSTDISLIIGIDDTVMFAMLLSAAMAAARRCSHTGDVLVVTNAQRSGDIRRFIARALDEDAVAAINFTSYNAAQTTDQHIRTANSCCCTLLSCAHIRYASAITVIAACECASTIFIDGFALSNAAAAECVGLIRQFAGAEERSVVITLKAEVLSNIPVIIRARADSTILVRDGEVAVDRGQCAYRHALDTATMTLTMTGADAPSATSSSVVNG